MKKIAIIQARLGSKRLSNKVMLEIPRRSGITCLERVFEKVKQAELPDDIVLATPDVELGLIAAHHGINYSVYHGKRDVIREFMVAADKMDADLIVRITADCPMIISEEIDRCIDEFLDNYVDLIYNTDESVTMDGDGTDVEVFSYNALEKAYLEAQEIEREHITLWMRRNLNCLYLPVENFIGCSLNNYEQYKRICRFYEKEEKTVLGECSSGRNGNGLDECRSG